MCAARWAGGGVWWARGVASVREDDNTLARVLTHQTRGLHSPRQTIVFQTFILLTSYCAVQPPRLCLTLPADPRRTVTRRVHRDPSALESVDMSHAQD